METVALRGGAWLFDEVADADVFTPEKLTEEHRLIAKTTEEFMVSEVLPHLERLESKDWAFSRHLIKRAGELGLLGLAAPEQYGGLDLDKASSLVVVEQVALSASFATTFGGQSNLCVLPLVLFGTAEQKAAYLPPLIAGEIIGAYALSESGSGSDALAARTRAMKLADGSWSLTGEKMWISNGGFADLFIVFAKVDGEQFTAFLVERAFPGVSTGKEEHKMGLHGSSTTPLILQDARVPAGHVLGAIGRGHKVALNTLNYGRFSLGAMCAGGAKAAIGDAARYAAGRKQFGQPVASFGAIKHKLGEMTARAYAAECLSYRTAGLIDAALDNSSSDGAVDRQGVRGVRHRVLDLQGDVHRDAGFRARRERPDPRRQRLRARLHGRALLSRRAREPHLRGHQRDQPPADPGHAGAPRPEGRAAAGRSGQAAAGRDPVAGAWCRRGRRRAAGLGTARRCRVQAGGRDGDRHRAPDLRRSAREPSRRC